MKFGHGIKIVMSSTRNDVSFNLKDGSIQTIDLAAMRKAARRRFVSEMIVDWKKGRGDLPLARAL